MKRTLEEDMPPPPPLVPVPNQQEEGEANSLPEKKKRKRVEVYIDANGFLFNDKIMKKATTGRALPKADQLCYMADLLPETRKGYLYPHCDVPSLGYLARTCKAFALDLCKDKKSVNWLPVDWRALLFNCKVLHRGGKVRRALHFLIHDLVRPSGYFARVPTTTRPWKVH